MKKMLILAEQCCARIAQILAFILFSLLFLSGLGLTASLCKQTWGHEVIVYMQDNAVLNVLLILLMLSILLLLFSRIRHVNSIKLGAALLGIWSICSIALVVGANIVQMYDFAYVLEAAQLFAGGNYKSLTIDYFNVYSYQLGICLPMEIIKRIIPSLNLSVFMQILNVFLSAGFAGIMALLCRILFSDQESKMSLILYVLFLPLALQCVFVYGTLPMLFFVSLALLCLALYFKNGSLRFGLAYVFCISFAYMLKPNAAIVLLAISICAFLRVLTTRDVKLLLLILLSAITSVLLQKLAIGQYELRGGVSLDQDVSMLARLVMGLQRGGAQAGWFNRYTEQFFPLDVSQAQEYSIASADLAARLAEMKSDPAGTWLFFKDKLLSQWLEPSYGAMWYGDLCAHSGPFAEKTKQLFLDGGTIRTVLERLMSIYQKMLYLLSAVGIWGMIRKKKVCLAALILPVCVLGGCLYHMIFEAKAQYMYPYVLLIIPIAAHGAYMIATLLNKRIHQKRP